MAYDQEQRGSSGGVLGSMLNPVENLKYQYLSGWAALTYAQMMRTGGTSIQPFFMAGFIPGVRGLGTKLAASNNIFSRVAGGMLKGFDVGGIRSSVGRSLGAMTGLKGEELSRFVSTYNKNIHKAISKNAWKSLSNRELSGVLRGVGLKSGAGIDVVKNFLGRTADGAALPSMFRNAMTVSRLGTAGLGITLGVTLGSGAAHAMGMAFKGALASIDYANAAIEHMKALEFGGTLGPGFRTGAAVTERQRAVQELQRIPLSGRRFLGDEASIYAGLI